MNQIDEKILSYIKKYLLSFAVMGAVTWFVLAIREHSSSLPLDVKYLNLADAFTIPAVIMLMVGVLVWLASQGTFDMLSYGFIRAKESFIPSAKYKHETFYDYKVRRGEKRIRGYSFMFISGGIYIIPALIFNILYYTA